MVNFIDTQSRDTVLLIGSYLEPQREALHKLGERLGKRINALVVIDERMKNKDAEVAKDPFATIIYVDTKKEIKMAKALKPYQDRLLVATCRSDSNIPYLIRLIPHIPYLLTPTEESLKWATEKLLMRRMLRNYNTKISPAYTVVHDATDESIAKIEKKVGYPLVIKPSGLGASLLVSVCYHREELVSDLKKAIRKMKTVYKRKQGRGEPTILVEQLMDGSMYSIDAYVSPRGIVHYCPPVHVKTGKQIGFDDFFGYQQMTPTLLKPSSIERANETVGESIKALGLRSTTIHAELMRTNDGWKIIEVGPRIGGFRHKLYEMSYGFDHSLNDILVRLPKKPIINKKILGHSAFMKIYSKKEGRLVQIKGRNLIRKLESFVDITIKAQSGDRVLFAKNGGDAVMVLALHNKSRSKLLADIRRIEQSVKITVDK